MSRLRIKLKSYNKTILMNTVFSLQEKFRSVGLGCIIAFVKHNKSLIVYNSSHHCYAKTNKKYACARESKVSIYIEGQRNLIMNQLNSFTINSEIRATHVGFIGATA